MFTGSSVTGGDNGVVPLKLEVIAPARKWPSIGPIAVAVEELAAL